MNIENELKLIPKKGISKNKVIGLLRELGIDAPEQGKIIHQEDSYFDDKNGTLEKSGGSFRIRRKGNKTQVTCKIPVESNTEYKQRKEYEITVPKEYEQSLDMELAIKLLKQQYPELVFPENMREVVTVINDRNKFDLTCQDGTVLEMAFDSLKGRDESGKIYSIRPEIEFETLSGNPDNLISVYETILKEFPGQVQRNVLSKYARTKKEIEDKKLTLEELSACAWFSQILSSTQFDKLKYKGQILHRYDKPTLPQLDNFKDFSYLVDRISEIKSGEYKIPVPRNIAEKEGKRHLIESGNYEVTDDIDLEDMFCILLSDAHYEIADEVLADFFDKNYYQDDKAMTNRLSHSQQVMLATGLICKSSQVGANSYERLTAMMSALSHDIGHVPYSHLMEQELQDKIGAFSHDNNGAEVIGKIYDNDNENMFNNIQNYYQEKYGVTQNNYEIKEALKKQKNIIQTAIREHSRTNSEKRGKGIIVQGPREADKIQYVCSDIRDLQKFFKDNGMQQADFFSEDFVEKALEEICQKKPYEYDDVKQKIYSLFIDPIKQEKYGIAAVNIINTVKYSRYDNKEYYDVDQDIWKFIEHTIAKTKDIRKEKGIDDTRTAIKSFSRYITSRKLVGEYLEPNEGDRKKAREEGLQDITNMGELDGIDYANDDLLGLSKEDFDRFKKGDYTQVTDEQLKAIRKRTYELLSRVFTQTGHGNEEELKELAQEVESYDVKELIETYLSAPVITKVDEKNLEQFKVEDVQLKINPSSKVTATSILRIIGNGDEKYENISFDDFYFESNLPDKKLSLRKIHKKDGQEVKMLRVKEKIEKKVKEIIRNVYEVKGQKEDSPEELLKNLNEKYPGLNIEFANKSPYKHVSAQRVQWTYTDEKGQKIEIREDIGTSIDNRDGGKKEKINQIEIHGDAKTISKIKKKLMKYFGEEISFTQETKEGGTNLEQPSGNSGGEER